MEPYPPKSVRLSDAADQLDALADSANAGATVRLKRGRKVVAVLMSPEDAEIVARGKREMEADVRAYDRAKREIERDGSHPIPWEEVKRELAARRKRKS
jgi:hypothetical protein